MMLTIYAALRVNSYSELQLGEHATDFLAARAAGLVSADTNTSSTDTLQTPDGTNSQHPRINPMMRQTPNIPATASKHHNYGS